MRDFYVAAYKSGVLQARHLVGAADEAEAEAVFLRRYFDGKGFAGHGSDPWPPLWESQTVAMVTYTF